MRISDWSSDVCSSDLPEAENDIAVLLFTSGTTGEPKAAVLRHANLTSYVMSTVEFLGADEEEAALVSVPSYHIAGISAILTSAYGGQIGKASCRERVCQYCLISGVAVSLKKKTKITPLTYI